MQFLHAAALWGLALVAVPIIIHLITRRRALRKPFAAIRFVLLSHRVVRRRLRLKRILILLARILAVVMLALIVAHPTMPLGGRELHMGDAPRSLVIIVDNSMSMVAGPSAKKALDTAISLATSIAGSMGAGQEAAVLTTNPNAENTSSPLTAEPDALERAIKKIKPSYVYRPITESISEATAVLESAHHELRQILLITDLQRAPWAQGAAAPAGNTRLIVLDAGGNADLDNAAIAGVELEPSAGEARYNALADVAAFAKKPMPGKELSVLVGEETRARGFLDLPARGQVRKSLAFSAGGSGTLRGVMQLSPDAMESDNRRYFTASASGRISALVVDGDPKPERYGSESFYLMNALNPKLEARSRVDPTLVTVAGLAKTTLDNYDVVILANVGVLDTKMFEVLKKYVSNGGALIISLGNNTDPKTFAESFRDLAPAGLYILKELSAPTHLDAAGSDHPAARLFATSEEGDLTLASFFKYYLLDPSSVKEKGLNTVLRFQDGAPALVEKSSGRGRVALWTSTLDRDWNDLCIYPTYLPLLQQLALYLTGGMSDPLGSAYTVGETARFTCPAQTTAANIYAPDNTRIQTDISPDGDVLAGSVSLKNGPGFCEIFCMGKDEASRRPNRDPDRLLAVNIDLRESDLERWEPKALEQYLKQKGFQEAKAVKDMSELAKDEGFKPGRRDAARWVIAALVAILLIEGFLTRKG